MPFWTQIFLTGWVAALLLGPAAAQSPDVGLSPEVDAVLADLQRQIDELKTTPAPTIPETKPDYPTVRLTGFFQADTVWFRQSEANIAAVDDLQDGADFRRARLAAVGNVWTNISYILEMDFGFPGRPSFMDVWLQIDDVLGDNHLRIGQYRQPFGMEGLTSAKELTFLERSLPFAFLPFRQSGTMLWGTAADETITYATSVYRFPTDVFGGNLGDSGGYGTSNRLTALLLDQPCGGGTLHVGGAYTYIDPSNDQIRYRSTPEIFIDEGGGGVVGSNVIEIPPFVDTGVIDANHANLYGAELAGSYGRAYAQAEAIYANVNPFDGPSAGFSGAYAYTGFFLTGEQRTYDRTNAVFGDIVPRQNFGRGGWGAIEATARYSYLDLNGGSVLGGRLSDVTVGFNWHLNPNTKFQFNYIHAMLDDPAFGESRAGITAFRAHLDF